MKLRVASLAWLLLGSTVSAHEPRVRVLPSVFDPAHTGAVVSRWVPLFSPRGGEALIMTKLVPTADDAAAVASVEGARAERLDELGFDVFNGGHCGAGAPRFNVTLEDGTVYFFGCAYGDHSGAPGAPALFTRVRFADADAFAQLPTDPPWPGFGHARIKSIDVVMDEGTDVGSGFTALDDVDVNGELVGHGPL